MQGTEEAGHTETETCSVSNSLYLHLTSKHSRVKQIKGHCVEMLKTYIVKQKAMQKVSSMPVWLMGSHAQLYTRIQPLILLPPLVIIITITNITIITVIMKLLLSS